MVQTECVENDTKEISPAGLAESLCAPPSPRSFQNLVFYVQTLVFFFKKFGLFGRGVGKSGICFYAKFEHVAFYFQNLGFFGRGLGVSGPRKL